METLWLLVSQAHGVGRVRKRGRGGGWGNRLCGERPGVCNSNGQIVIAERFDRWIMTSNDTPRWESKPPLFPPPLPACPMQPPLVMPLSLFSPFLSLVRLLAMCCLYHTGMRMWIWDCVMHMQLHLASDYARPITAVKLDCRRLSPVDRPNKTWIFSGITAVPLSLCALWFRSCILWGTTGNAGRYLCPFTDNVADKGTPHISQYVF